MNKETLPRAFRIKVIEPGPTYLTAGEVYTVTRCAARKGGEGLEFRNERNGSGTFEAMRRWNAFINLGRMTIERL